MSGVTRYHPLLVTLHWLMAALIVILLLAGTFLLAPLPSTDPLKIDGLFGHMLFGVSVMALLIVRLIVKMRTAAPPHVETGNVQIDRAGALAHWALYALIFIVAGSGMAMSVLAGLPDIVFFGSGDPLPESFWVYPPRYVHAIATKLLAGLIVLHVAAAIWHQFVRKDGLLARMGFGKRHV